jgi:hypothetical protein
MIMIREKSRHVRMGEERGQTCGRGQPIPAHYFSREITEMSGIVRTVVRSVAGQGATTV